jgi:TRAP-type transport system periplasmic protein
VNLISLASDLIDDPVDFVRRVPRALSWRLDKAWDPVARSGLRRAAVGQSIWLARSLRPRSTRRSAPKPLVLRFANTYGSRFAELDWFADEVAELSSGAIRIEFVDKWATAHNPCEETATVAGVMADQADLGWAGTRAFGCLGVRSLDPLQAPFLLQEYASLDAVCRADLTYEMLAPLDRLGLVGLVVLPGPHRKPFAFTRRLAAPRDFAGARLRAHESLVADATYRALGAQPVTLSARQMASQPDVLIDGLDLHVEALAGWGFRGSVTYNVNLWPRTIAIVASRRSYRWLGATDQEILHEAARRTLGQALDHLAGQEQRDRDSLPTSASPIYADDDQLALMRSLVEPVHDDLRKHAETGAFLERLETIVSRPRLAVSASRGSTTSSPG